MRPISSIAVYRIRYWLLVIVYFVLLVVIVVITIYRTQICQGVVCTGQYIRLLPPDGWLGAGPPRGTTSNSRGSCNGGRGRCRRYW